MPTMAAADFTHPDLMAPGFALFVEDTALSIDVTEYVQSIRYEQSVDMASAVHVQLANPGHRFTDVKLLAPGNELDVWMGYGNNLSHIGRATLIRHLPSFPSDGVPMLELVGYDRMHALTQNETKIGDNDARRLREKEGKMHRGTIGAVVSQLLLKYGLKPDISPAYMTRLLPGSTPLQVGTAYQRRGTSDAEFLRALANLVDAETFVEYRPLEASIQGLLVRRTTLTPRAAATGLWVGVFREPPKSAKEAFYIFRYGQGDASSIVNADLEFGLPAAITELTVFYYSKGQWIAVTEAGEAFLKSPLIKTVTEHYKIKGATQKKIKESRTTGETFTKKPITSDELAKADPQGLSKKVDEGGRRVTRKVKVREALPGFYEPGGPAEAIEDGELKGMFKTKIAAGGYAIDVGPSIRFTTAKEAIAWARWWIAKHADNLITLKMTTIGVENARAGEVHRVEGLGKRYDGDYYFVAVEHRWDSGGYLMDVTARKILDEEETRSTTTELVA